MSCCCVWLEQEVSLSLSQAQLISLIVHQPLAVLDQGGMELPQQVNASSCACSKAYTSGNSSHA